jgi:long-chain acyl-CoA synthetase
MTGFLWEKRLSLIEPLFQQAQRQPDELAVIDDRGRYTYQQLATMAAGMGGSLASQTQRPRVGLMLPSGAGFAASFYGAMLAGKAVVPLNFLLADREILHCIADSAIDTVVTIPQLAPRLKDAQGINVIDLTQLPQPTTPLVAAPKLPTPADDDLAVLMYTSGTSGLPKGVLLTHRNIESNVNAAIEAARLEHRHKFLGIVPLFHAFGMTAMMLAPIQLGASIVYMARFSPVGALNAIKEHGISLLMGVPSMFAAMARLKNASADDFKTIYAMISGGEPLPAALRETFAQRFGVTLYEAYGMTETSLAVALNTPHAHRAGSVGRPVPGMHVKLDPEDGEILLKGPMVMKGYNNLPEQTAAAFTADGYFRTGDLGTIDADGFIFITGRKKDLIIIAGEKASPREIEELLMTHPSVSEAAVIGKKDPNRGEVVAAYVISREGQSADADELREFCRKQGLAQWKVPREINIVQDLPRSASGKVLKRELK